MMVRAPRAVDLVANSGGWRRWAVFSPESAPCRFARNSRSRPYPTTPPVPDDTARVARAAFRRGNACLILRDRLGTLFTDADFADLYPKRGQPAYAP